MSELENREGLSRFDSLSTEELQEILRKHNHGELETEPDTQDLFEIMEVLSKRRQQQNPQAFRLDEEAFAEFRKHYMPKESRTVAQHKATKLPSRLLRTMAAVLAVVLILTAGTSITAKALNYDIWRKFADWTIDFFSFENVSGPNIAKTDKTFSIEYNPLRETLATFGIDEKIIPSWLPNGYKHKDIMVVQSPKEIFVHAIYDNGNVELIISIRQIFGVEPTQIEKDNAPIEIYTVDGIEYYIFSNTETSQIAWVVDGFDCQVIGRITTEEMKAMIDSI